MVLAATCGGLALLCWRGALRAAAVQSRLGPARSRRPGRPPRAAAAARRRRRADTVAFVAAVGAELAAGAGWETALLRAADEGSTLASPLLGSPSPHEVLRRLSVVPGAEGLAALAAVGDLSLQTGASASRLAERVAEVLRAEDRSRRAVDVELASALASARLLAALPVVGLLMGAAVGADPLRVLLFSGAGRGCLVAALLLELAGVLWCRRIRRVALG